MKHVLIFLIPFLFTSCKNENNKEGIILSKNNKSAKEKINMTIIDSTIALTKIQSSNNCDGIKETEAKWYLYKYFRNKGVIPRHEIKNYSQEILCIEYDTIYNLKSNKTCSAIIYYWLNPADLNGTCVTPKMAIVSKKSNGLQITNEEFLNSDFGIDSIADDLTVFFSKYDCTQHKVLNKYKVKLELK